MNLSESHIEAIWSRFVQNTRSPKNKSLRPIVNLLGSVTKHKKLFMDTYKDYIKIICTHPNVQNGICIDCKIKGRQT